MALTLTAILVLAGPPALHAEMNAPGVQRDEIVWDSWGFDENVEMARRLQAAGCPVHKTVYPGTVHSFLEAVGWAAVSRRAMADSCAWLRGQCSRHALTDG